MDEQVSIFDAFEALSAPTPPPDVPGKVKGFQFLDSVQVKADEDPLVAFQERLRRYFGKGSVLQDGKLWIPWARRWTFCVAKTPPDKAEADRGIRHIYRAVYEAAT